MRASFRFLIAAFLTAALATAAEDARPSHLAFRREAEAAYQRKDYRAALASVQAALELRPDSPRYLHNLAALLVRTGNTNGAFAPLRRIAALGVVTDIERDPDLAPLQGTPEFAQLRAQFAANREPRGELEPLAELPGRTGLIEGIAVRERTGDLFLSDVHHRCIWRRTRGGEVTRFTAEDDELPGILGLATDESRNTLWAALSALPEMAGYETAMRGHAGLAEFDLTNGELRRVIAVPNDGREHSLGDLVVAPDGTVYATDSKAPIVWQFAPDTDEPQKVVDSPIFGSLQGLALERGTLLVADHANGLFAIDLATRNITELTAPADTTLVGLDGIAAIPGGLVCIQNGVTPQRVLRVSLAAGLDRINEVKVLASGQPELTDLTLVTLWQGRPTFIAGSGWDVFDVSKAKEPSPHTVRILQTPLAE